MPENGPPSRMLLALLFDVVPSVFSAFPCFVQVKQVKDFGVFIAPVGVVSAPDCDVGHQREFFVNYVIQCEWCPRSRLTVLIAQHLTIAKIHRHGDSSLERSVVFPAVLEDVCTMLQE